MCISKQGFGTVNKNKLHPKSHSSRTEHRMMDLKYLFIELRLETKALPSVLPDGCTCDLDENE